MKAWRVTFSHPSARMWHTLIGDPACWQASEADSDVDGSNTSVVHLTGFTIVNGNRSRVSATLRSDSLTGRVAIGAAPLPATDVRAHALDELSSVM